MSYDLTERESESQTYIVLLALEGFKKGNFSSFI
jgi:hypothetical protein